jgi:predicted ATP-dependent endonuclease of OLD family
MLDPQTTKKITMQLSALRLTNFQCFGPETQEITFEDSTTMIIGPNGSGKTAILQALSRMFDANPGRRRVRADDFHVGLMEEDQPEERSFIIEADFLLPEAATDSDANTIPPCFNHMRLDEGGEILKVRFRLAATMGPDGDIADSLSYVLGSESNGEDKLKVVPRSDRNHIAVYYLPARRDPDDHIRSNTTSLLGRIVRAIRWEKEAESYKDTVSDLQDLIEQNPAIKATSESISENWAALHKGSHLKDATVTFGADSLEKLIQNFSVQFSPAHASQNIDYSLLSDGQKSLLYLSLVCSYIEIGRKAMAEEEEGDLGIDLGKLAPPVFSIIAIEEPENSLSPHYLGRINKSLAKTCSGPDAQAIVTTHAPSMLRRIAPEHIRFTRLGTTRTASVKSIDLPPDSDLDAHKFVREGLISNPEIYFARMVVLGEGASEDIVLPKLFEASNLPFDENGIVLAQLGGRHVNYLWKILSDLGIPYATLLDLDLARHGGGWGRIKYARDQLRKVGALKESTAKLKLAKWNESSPLEASDDDDEISGERWLNFLKKRGVFFSQPLDLDFSLILTFPDAYGISSDDQEAPDEAACRSVLGKSHAGADWYSDDQMNYFEDYHRLFKVGSKPAAHIEALSNLNLEQIEAELPEQYRELIAYVTAKLQEVFE